MANGRAVAYCPATAVANPTSSAPTSYKLTGPINPRTFLGNCEKQFVDAPKWNKASEPDVLFVLGKLVADPRIGDIRYVAYTLATIFVETSHTIKVTARTKDARGAVKTHVLKQWRNFVPVKEVIGRKDRRNYKDAVKICRLSNGSARVTERDGDQWEVTATGNPNPVKPTALRGTVPNGPVSPIYVSDKGDEQVYWGRGYVQLTWWSNYAKAGADLGRGLALLYKPDLVLDRDIAYEIMIRGLTTGSGFANGRSFAKYFNSKTDYVHARNMVNGGASLKDKQDFAVICERFEAALMASRG